MMGDKSGATPTAFLERLPLAADRPVLGYGAALLFCAVGYGTRVAVGDLLPPGFPFVTFFPAVILAAFLFGLGPGIVAALLCAVASTQFLAGPAPLATLGGLLAMAFYVFVVVTDVALVHWMQRANARLARARERNRLLAEQRELLFRELQHRVSNNLQVVAALLALQRRHLADPDARTAIDQASSRLALIGSIQRQLYDPSGSRLAIGQFLAQLVDDLLESNGKPDIRRDISADAAVEIAPDAAIPLALIVAEAVANALEHGFAGRETGSIRIALACSPSGETVLDVIDDGAGLPPGFDLAGSHSLGLRIASTLARQIDGTFELKPRPDAMRGTFARLTLPG